MFLMRTLFLNDVICFVTQLHVIILIEAAQKALWQPLLLRRSVSDIGAVLQRRLGMENDLLRGLVLNP